MFRTNLCAVVQLAAGMAVTLAAAPATRATPSPVPDNKPSHYPDWWFEREVIPLQPDAPSRPTGRLWPDDYPAADDHAAANIGQLKFVATAAAQEFHASVPGGLPSTVSAIVNRWFISAPIDVARDDYALLNQGQLKAVAAPFYTGLSQIGFTSPLIVDPPFPWSASGADDDAYATVNLGQLKNVFSFISPSPASPTADLDQDGLPDEWEHIHFSGYLYTGADDKDGDGFPNRIEHLALTSPTSLESFPTAHYRVVGPDGEPDGITTFPSLHDAYLAAVASRETPEAPASPFRIIAITPGEYSSADDTELLSLILEDVLVIAEDAPLRETVRLNGVGRTSTGIVMGASSSLVGIALENIPLTLQAADTLVLGCSLRRLAPGSSPVITVEYANSAIVCDTTIEDNEAGALLLRSSSVALSRLVVRRNTSAEALDSALRLEGGCTVSVDTSLFTANDFPAAAALVTFLGSANQVRLRSSSLHDNPVHPARPVIGSRPADSLEVSGTVLWNPRANIEVATVGASAFSAAYSLIRLAPPGTGILSADPLLGPSGLPAANSPLLDQGEAVGAPLLDLYHQTRPFGLRADIGAVERQGNNQGMPPWWQLVHFGSPTALPTEDHDGDGISNLDEFLAGTNPIQALEGGLPVVLVSAGEAQTGVTNVWLPQGIKLLVTDSTGRPIRNQTLQVRPRDAAARVFAESPSPSEPGSIYLGNLVTDAEGSEIFYLKP